MKEWMKKKLTPIALAVVLYTVSPQPAQAGTIEYAAHTDHSTLVQTVSHPLVGDAGAFHKGKVTFSDGQGHYFGLTDISHPSGIEGVTLIGEVQYSSADVSFRPGLGGSPGQGVYLQGTTSGTDLELFVSAQHQFPIGTTTGGKPLEASLKLESIIHYGEDSFESHELRAGIGYEGTEGGIALSKKGGQPPQMGLYVSMGF
jgi:hypothetical protein